MPYGTAIVSAGLLRENMQQEGDQEEEGLIAKAKDGLGSTSLRPRALPVRPV
jgi:hypothetical protein